MADVTDETDGCRNRQKHETRPSVLFRTYLSKLNLTCCDILAAAIVSRNDPRDSQLWACDSGQPVQVEGAAQSGAQSARAFQAQAKTDIEHERWAPILVFFFVSRDHVVCGKHFVDRMPDRRAGSATFAKSLGNDTVRFERGQLQLGLKSSIPKIPIEN